MYNFQYFQLLNERKKERNKFIGNTNTKNKDKNTETLDERKKKPSFMVLGTVKVPRKKRDMLSVAKRRLKHHRSGKGHSPQKSTATKFINNHSEERNHTV